MIAGGSSLKYGSYVAITVTALLTAKNIEISFKSSSVRDKEIDGICEETVIILVY